MIIFFLCNLELDHLKFTKTYTLQIQPILKFFTCFITKTPQLQINRKSLQFSYYLNFNLCICSQTPTGNLKRINCQLSSWTEFDPHQENSLKSFATNLYLCCLQCRINNQLANWARDQSPKNLCGPKNLYFYSEINF